MAMTDLIPWRKSNDSLAQRSVANDPFMQLRRQIDDMFGGMLGDAAGRINLMDWTGRTFLPSIDLNETAKEIRVTAELPGMEQKDVEVSLLEGALCLKGEKHEQHEEEKGDVYRSERQYGAFQRVIPLPAEVDP